MSGTGACENVTHGPVGDDEFVVVEMRDPRHGRGGAQPLDVAGLAVLVNVRPSRAGGAPIGRVAGDGLGPGQAGHPGQGGVVRIIEVEPDPIRPKRQMMGDKGMKFPKGCLDRGADTPALQTQSASSNAAVGQASAGRPRRTCSACTALRVWAPRIPSIAPTSRPRAASFS